MSTCDDFLKDADDDMSMAKWLEHQLSILFTVTYHATKKD
jgi:hypothetical protein